MTDPTITALIEADKHRTPGKWYEHGATVWAPPDSDDVGSTCVAQECTNEDSAFIVAAANAMPAITEMANRIDCLEYAKDMAERDNKVTVALTVRQERELERLRAELAKLNDDTTQINSACDDATVRVAKLEAELAECRRDAERYRWIKKRCLVETYGAGRRPLLRLQFDAYATSLDTAIDEGAIARGDAALAQSGTEKDDESAN